MATLNFPALATDFPAELAAVESVYTGVKKLVDDAKAKSAVTVDIADVEVLLTPIEGAVKGAEKIVEDL